MPSPPQSLSAGMGPARGRGARWAGKLWQHLCSRTTLSLAGGFLLWEIVGRYVVTSKILFAPFSEVVGIGMQMLLHDDLLAHIRLSMLQFLLGFGLAGLVGVSIGVLMAASRWARDLLDPWVSFLYSSPLVALMPFYILVFGIGISSKVAIVFTVAVFPILLNTTTGIRSVDQNFVEVAQAFDCNRRQLFTYVLLPASLPYIMVGLRLGIGRGLTGVVVGELFASQAGLGHIIAQAGQSFDTPTLLMGVLVFSLFGVLLMKTVDWLERRVAPWRKLALEQE
ncbi:ABC transporter permease [Bordetella sp. BOR01]|uniref:ABC transporter permease n=1 Tax=Bordetella sp. BOR01 TaxID=2854779 RepID=UPI001C47CC1E|nr:ABC transporter permease [Bordetella sp. BOR01]MBV7483425.1 ABC transporter permease [Bordetella sp. BOR01]